VTHDDNTPDDRRTLHIGDEVTVTPHAIAAGTGHAVAREPGLPTLFITDAMPGDTVTVEVSRVFKRHVEAHVTTCVTRRDAAPAGEDSCTVATTCGGCRFWGATYDEELRWKTDAVRATMERIAPNVAWPVAQIVADPNGERYRARARFRVTSDGTTGFLARRSDQVVASTVCRTVLPGLDEGRAVLQPLLKRLGVAGELLLEWDEVQRGLTALLRVSPRAPSPQETRRALADHPMTDHLLTLVVSSPQERDIVFGDGLVQRAHGQITVRVPVGSFRQANLRLNRALVRNVCDAVGPARRVLELYAGSGNFTFPLSEHAQAVCAVEGAGDALDAAREAASIAKLSHISFMTHDLRRGIPHEVASQTWDASVADPPRGGLPHPLIDALTRVTRSRIVVVSCDPPTLARDAARFAQRGWAPVEFSLLDMFPRTPHVEAVAVFEPTARASRPG